MIVAAVAAGLSFGHPSNYVIGTLCFFRFWLGFGVGGDYPLSATIMSEYSTTKWRGALIGSVFAMQGMGLLTAAMVITSIINSYYGGNPQQADVVWRIVLVLAAILTALTLYARSKMPETPRFTLLVQGDQETTNKSLSQVLHEETKRYKKSSSDFFHFCKKYWKSLLGCARRGSHAYITPLTPLHALQHLVPVGYFLLQPELVPIDRVHGH
jgi:PHS family inorganic phosphate transporter-like MFS transporter